jgi:hypothetical protein
MMVTQMLCCLYSEQQSQVLCCLYSIVSVLVGQQQQWEYWLSADCKQYVTVKITFQCCSVQMNVVQLLLVVVKCVKCGVGLLF